MQDENENVEQDKEDEPILGKDEVFAWHELRLHPLLVNAMRRLGFKEPTPIQKSCFPAAAHQGKVCPTVHWLNIDRHYFFFFGMNVMKLIFSIVI